jgi:protein-tyrosine phosphatase
MFKILNYITAPLKVVYDKVWDYIFFNSNDMEELLGNTPRYYDRIKTHEQCKHFFSEPTHIIDNIYLGSAYNAASYYKLKELDIGLIINVTNEISEYYPNDFSYKKYDLYDNNKDTIKYYLEDSYNYINEYNKNNENKNIFIHCFMGASRSASIVIYYLLKKNQEKNNQFTILDAINFIKQKRQVINPTKKLLFDINCESKKIFKEKITDK